MAGGRHRPGHPVGRHPRRLELPGLRRGEIRFRDGGGRALVTVTVARVTSPRDPRGREEREVSRTAQRIPYAEASRVLLRDSILDGMRELLLTRDWSSITLSDVAKAAGISRQTIYNEFGSRQGLAQGYALRLADRLVDQIESAIGGNVGDIY